MAQNISLPDAQGELESSGGETVMQLNGSQRLVRARMLINGTLALTCLLELAKEY